MLNFIRVMKQYDSMIEISVIRLERLILRANERAWFVCVCVLRSSVEYRNNLRTLTMDTVYRTVQHAVSECASRQIDSYIVQRQRLSVFVDNFVVN